jgi:hypothetical protein
MNPKITNNIGTAIGATIIAYFIYLRPGIVILVAVPIVVYILMHYFILQKLFGQKYPFIQQWKSNHPYNRAMSLYGLFCSTSFLFAIPILILMKYLNTGNTINLVGPGIFVLFLSSLITLILLIFSRFFFEKSLSETWKAILFAGIIAGATGYATSYALWKNVGPYLPCKGCKVQPTHE